MKSEKEAHKSEPRKFELLMIRIEQMIRIEK
jgi:hypothetical protein